MNESNNKSSGMQVFIKIQNGKTIVLEVPKKETIEKLKSQIEKKEGIPISKQRLIYNTKELENENSMAYYNIQPESNILLNLKLGGGVLVVINSLEGQSVEIDIDEDDTIESLKLKIYEKQGTAVEMQRLIYEKRKLDDNKTIADYQMKENSQVRLVKAAAK